MYEELVKNLRGVSRYTAGTVTDLCKDAADTIEELSRQRDRAYDRPCGWCHVCPMDKRNPEGCEFAALIAEAIKGTNVPTYDLLYEEGGAGTT